MPSRRVSGVHLGNGKSMSDPYIISVILNTNRRDDTLECLETLMRSHYQNHSALVLDNHSTDGSVEAIRAKFPEVEIFALQENLGYAGNNNVGIKLALEKGADWVFVLNEDTILDPDCLAHLARSGESDPSIGVIGPLVYHHSEPHVIQTAGGTIDRYWDTTHIAQDEEDTGQISGLRPADFISGCGIMVRRAAIDQVGVIDERFFYYKEETEWCLRIRKAGWKIFVEPQAKMWHKGVTRNHQPKPHVTYYKTRNRFLMLSKHHAPLLVWVMVWMQVIRTLASWTIKPKWKHMRGHRDCMWRGIWDFLRRRWGKMPA